jgi:hypothetical protein
VAELLLVFLAGLAGSMHCVGMCGGFACGLGGDARGAAATLQRHLIYHAGRLASYCFLGALAGQLGWLLVAPSGVATAGLAATLQQGLSWIAGGLMAIVGLQFLGVLPRAAVFGHAGEGLVRALRGLLRAPGPAAPLALGVLNGLLPCPLVYAVVAYAAACGKAVHGWQIMAAFGLGTLPALLALGGFGWWWQRRTPGTIATVAVLPQRAALRVPWRVHGVKLAGSFLLLLGAITLMRGLPGH